jgi:Flp pilus assembly protein TadD
VNPRASGLLAAGLAAALSVGFVAGPALAKAKPAAGAPAFNIDPAEVQAALDEQRFVDAGRMIDKAVLSGAKDPQFQLFAAELDLARGRYDSALKRLKAMGEPGAYKGRMTQDRGLALSMLGRSDEAFATLKQAIIEDAGAWRAWSALGGEYDRRRDWKNAEDAYDKALAASPRNALVLNNRGFSRVLQNRLDEGIADLVAALERKPDLTAARTNLRLAMALKGDYDRALAAGPQEDKAALFNNVGYAALLRGDQVRAQEFFSKAIAARGEFYGRASTNLEMAAGLKSEPDAKPAGANGQR